MNIKTIGSPTLHRIPDHEAGPFVYRFTVDVVLYCGLERNIHWKRNHNSFPEKPFTYLNCLELEALNEEYVQTMKPTPMTPEEREQRYQELIQEINDQLIIRCNNGGFLEHIVDDDE